MMVAINKRKDKFHVPSCLYFLLAGILVSVQAGFEHTCTSDDISGGRRLFCGRQLTELVFARCGGEPAGRRKRSTSRASQIFLGKDDANSLLRTKRNLATGIVCECCVNRCSSRELNQYCAEPTRRRRSVRSIVTGGVAEPASPFTEDIVNKIYEEIAVESKVSQARTFTLDDHLKMEIVEENKRENILATSPPRDSGLPSGNLQKSLEPLNSDMRPISLTNYLNSNTDRAKLISKSLSAKHIHRHHKSLKRKHHHKS